MKYDITIVGAGIVGLATAYKLAQAQPTLRIAVVEKEKAVGLHQTGNNSGVIHSGIYYKPGSLKAINCKKGYDELLIFAKKHSIAHDICGKIIVATHKIELTALDNIFKRGVENGLQGIRKIAPDEVKNIEPHVQSVEAIWVPQTGIIDFPALALKYAQLIENQGHKLFLNHKVLKISTKNDTTVLHTEGGDIETKLLINCAGLHADTLAKMTHADTDIQILPFRGEYYELKKEKQYLVKNLIYPVPNPNFPFLGVHFTRMIHGGIEAGPNAVLAFKREGYNRKDINWGELWATLKHSGFRKIAVKYWREGLDEMYRSYSKQAFVKALQKLIPEIQVEDVTDGGAGVRAQACNSKGNLIDDFLILEKSNIIHVCNAPSPAATASLAIGETIAAKALKQFLR
jgi:(S)-2-hydroxyglutarate dehydrogenase